MGAEFYAFGEILWDCLPTERHAGGAPFNVTAHLAQLGASAAIFSAVGNDALGEEILEAAQAKGVDVGAVSRSDLATGTVRVALDAAGNATYEIVQPVAWDEIRFVEAQVAELGRARGLVFGSLAARSGHNLAQLERLLAVVGPVKFFDVNLRPPFVDLELVRVLAGKADVLKLNDIELGQLSGESDAQAGCAALARETGVARVCVTRGAAGALFWDDGAVFTAAAPRVTVRDTVGAGDAFMAGLMMGLTRGETVPVVLEKACRLGAYVASQAGATPRLPPELRDSAGS